MYCHSCSLCRPLGAHSWHHYPPPLCRLHPLRKCCDASPRSFCMSASYFFPFHPVLHPLRQQATRHVQENTVSFQTCLLSLCVPMYNIWCHVSVSQDLDNETLNHIDAENRRQTLEEDIEFMRQVHEQVRLVWFTNNWHLSGSWFTNRNR